MIKNRKFKPLNSEHKVHSSKSKWMMMKHNDPKHVWCVYVLSFCSAWRSPPTPQPQTACGSKFTKAELKATLIYFTTASKSTGI